MKLLILLAVLGFSRATRRLQERYSWNVMDWNYPDDRSRQQALASGDLIQENALPVGVERWGNKLFVTVPRWRGGIPATLNYIPLDGPYDPSPKLTPYPSLEANEAANCIDGMTTAYRIKADKCNRLWVLDTGTIGLENTTYPCPFAINVFDLNTDQRIRRYVLRPEDINSNTFIANIAIDIGYNCDDTFAYLSDELGYGLIVYDWQHNRSWRFSHSYFMPDPLLGDFNIGGLNFIWGSEGIFGITPSPIGSDGYRTLYFSPLASHTEFAVSTRVLRNESKVPGNYRDFRVVGHRNYGGHLTAKVMADNGVQLFNMVDQNSIGCWDSTKSYHPDNMGIVDNDDVRLVFPCDVKIDHDNNVWVMSDRMPVFLYSDLDYSDINFRIFTTPLDMLLQGTVCESPQSNKLYQPNIGQLNPYTNNNVGPVIYNTPLSLAQNGIVPYNPQIKQTNFPQFTLPGQSNGISQFPVPVVQNNGPTLPPPLRQNTIPTFPPQQQYRFPPTFPSQQQNRLPPSFPTQGQPNNGNQLPVIPLPQPNPQFPAQFQQQNAIHRFTPKSQQALTPQFPGLQQQNIILQQQPRQIPIQIARPQVASYINFANQPSVPYITSQGPQSNPNYRTVVQHNRNWVKREYEVNEDS